MFLSLLTFTIALQLAGDTAYVKRGRVYVEPLGSSFELPGGWADTAAAGRTSTGGTCEARRVPKLYLAPARARSVLQAATGEWDREYSAVADSTLRFEDVVVHAGAEGWGAESQCFSDLQMRLYVVGGTAQEVVRHVQDRGVATASRFFPASHSVDDRNGWTVAQLSWRAHYHDYGSTAHMDYYIREVSGRTAILLFMYADGFEGAKRERDHIIATWTASPQSPLH